MMEQADNNPFIFNSNLNGNGTDYEIIDNQSEKAYDSILNGTAGNNFLAENKTSSIRLKQEVINLEKKYKCKFDTLGSIPEKNPYNTIPSSNRRSNYIFQMPEPVEDHQATKSTRASSAGVFCCNYKTSAVIAVLFVAVSVSIVLAVVLQSRAERTNQQTPTILNISTFTDTTTTSQVTTTTPIKVSTHIDTTTTNLPTSSSTAFSTDFETMPSPQTTSSSLTIPIRTENYGKATTSQATSTSNDISTDVGTATTNEATSTSNEVTTYSDTKSTPSTATTSLKMPTKTDTSTTNQATSASHEVSSDIKTTTTVPSTTQSIKGLTDTDKATSTPMPTSTLSEDTTTTTLKSISPSFAGLTDSDTTSTLLTTSTADKASTVINLSETTAPSSVANPDGDKNIPISISCEPSIIAAADTAASVHCTVDANAVFDDYHITFTSENETRSVLIMPRTGTLSTNEYKDNLGVVGEIDQVTLYFHNLRCTNNGIYNVSARSSDVRSASSTINVTVLESPSTPIIRIFNPVHNANATIECYGALGNPAAQMILETSSSTDSNFTSYTEAVPTITVIVFSRIFCLPRMLSFTMSSLETKNGTYFRCHTKGDSSLYSEVKQLNVLPDDMCSGEDNIDKPNPFDNQQFIRCVDGRTTVILCDSVVSIVNGTVPSCFPFQL